MALPIYAGAKQTFAQTNTDWQDEYFKRNALITQHNLSVSGGNATSRFYTSGGYFKQDGIAQASLMKEGISGSIQNIRSVSTSVWREPVHLIWQPAL